MKQALFGHLAAFALCLLTPVVNAHGDHITQMQHHSALSHYLIEHPFLSVSIIALPILVFWIHRQIQSKNT
jgi:hypothetical protein